MSKNKSLWVSLMGTLFQVLKPLFEDLTDAGASEDHVERIGTDPELRKDLVARIMRPSEAELDDLAGIRREKPGCEDGQYEYVTRRNATLWYTVKEDHLEERGWEKLFSLSQKEADSLFTSAHRIVRGPGWITIIAPNDEGKPFGVLQSLGYGPRRDRKYEYWLVRFNPDKVKLDVRNTLGVETQDARIAKLLSESRVIEAAGLVIRSEQFEWDPLRLRNELQKAGYNVSTECSWILIEALIELGVVKDKSNHEPIYGKGGRLVVKVRAMTVEQFEAKFGVDLPELKAETRPSLKFMRPFRTGGGLLELSEAMSGDYVNWHTPNDWVKVAPLTQSSATSLVASISGGGILSETCTEMLNSPEGNNVMILISTKLEPVGVLREDTGDGKAYWLVRHAG